MTVAVASLVLAGVSAFAQIKAGEAQKKAYYSQARFKELEGRIEAVKAKEQGIKALENTRRALASVNATAFAGGLEPTIGTPNTFAINEIIKPGTSDFFTARDNAFLAISSSEAQAEDLRFAGRQAKRQGYISALGTLASAGMNYASLGGPGTAGTTGTTATYPGMRTGVQNVGRGNYMRFYGYTTASGVGVG